MVTEDDSGTWWEYLKVLEQPFRLVYDQFLKYLNGEKFANDW